MANLVTTESTSIVLQLQRGACSNASLTVTSVCDNELLFKVKTTNPDRYIVDRMAGTLAPKAPLSISVRTDPIKELWPLIGQDCPDKFLMQVALRPDLPEDEVVPDLWDKIPDDQIQNVLFRAVPELVGDWFRLDIDPPTFTLLFRPDEELKVGISVSNNDSMAIAFKILTNKPQRYTVEPASATVEPGAVLAVQIVSQPFQELPVSNLFNDTFLAKMVKLDGRPSDTVWQLCRKEETLSQVIPVRVITPESAAEQATKRNSSKSSSGATDVESPDSKPAKCNCVLQ